MATAVIKIAVEAVKIVLEIIGQAILGCLLCFLIPLSWLFSYVVGQGRSVVAILQNRFFEEAPINNPNMNAFQRLLGAFLAGIQSIGIFIQGQAVYITPLVGALAPMILVVVVIWFFGYFVMIFSGTIIKLINLLFTVAIVWIRVFAFAWNLAVEAISLGGSIWNLLVFYAIQVAGLIFHALCPNKFVFGLTSLLTTCPVLGLYISWLQIWWSVVILVVQTWFNILTTIYAILENIICPNGICDAGVCMSASMGTSCNYSVQLAFTWVALQIQNLIQQAWPFINIFIAFFIDLGSLVIMSFKDLFTLPVNASASIAQLFTGTSQLQTLLVTTQNTILPSSLTGLALAEAEAQLETEVIVIQILLIIEGIVKNTLAFMVNTLVTILFFVDTLLCNIFDDLVNCLIAKTCGFFFPTICVSLPGIGNVCLPLNTLVCVQALNLNAMFCKCDQCLLISPVGVVADLIFHNQNAFIPSGYVAIPCSAQCQPVCNYCNYPGSGPFGCVVGPQCPMAPTPNICQIQCQAFTNKVNQPAPCSSSISLLKQFLPA